MAPTLNAQAPTETESEIPDSRKLATLQKQQFTLYERGEFEQSLEVGTQALALAERTGPPDSMLGSLIFLAMAYHVTGRSEQAVPLYGRALAVAEQMGIVRPDGFFDEWSDLYILSRRFEEALPLFKARLAIAERVQDVSFRVDALYQLAFLYQQLGRYDEALPLAQRALAICEKAFEPENPRTVGGLTSLALLYKEMGRYDEALPLFQRVLLLVSRVSVADPSSGHEIVHVAADGLGYLLEHWPAGARTDEAIVYYKLSVNAGQRIRRDQPRQLRDFVTAKVSVPYHRLAGLLIARGRLAEAERVVLLLKESELNEFVRRNGDSASSAYEPLRWTTEEQAFADRLQTLAEALTRQLTEMAGLRERIRRGELTHDSEAWKRAESALQRENDKQLAALQELSARLVRDIQQARAKGIEAALESRSELARRQANLRTPEFAPLRLPATAALTWLADARGLTILVSTAGATQSVMVPVSEEQINKAAGALLAAIRARSDYRAPARALYGWLIAPAEPLLAASTPRVEHLMLNAIGALRDIPFAALVDPAVNEQHLAALVDPAVNDQHLIDRYALSLVTAQSAANLDRAPQLGWQLAALGASVAHSAFRDVALPAVSEELCGIVRDEVCDQGAITGRRYENQQFDRGELRHLLGAGNDQVPATAVHLATHYSVDKSLLLLGNKEVLPLNQLVAMDLRLGRYDLLTLSACDSAVGGAGVESLAGLLQEKGAKAVLATLWSVQDEGTAKLMVEFYRRRGEQRQVTKAEALRQAQQALLQGKVKSSDAKLDLRHPYFWAPFVLMGNWL